ncbi:MAG: hypothetical protein ACRDOA_08430 [Streptosporangiaceae bacterium]
MSVVFFIWTCSAAISAMRFQPSNRLSFKILTASAGRRSHGSLP